MSTTSPTVTLAALNSMNRPDFVAILAGVFEHSPWIAEAAWHERPFATVDRLYETMTAIVRRARPQRRLALIRAHPELAGTGTTTALTAASAREQAGAGLDRSGAGESAELRRLNIAYREKFGFPFVVAVRGLSTARILAELNDRLQNERAKELAQAIEEIARIARFRIDELLLP